MTGGPAERDPVDAHLARALAYAAIMPHDQFFTHTTAALIWGVPLPDGVVRRAVRPEVGVLAPARTPRGRGVTGRRLAASTVTLRVHPDSGVRVLSPASTWATLGVVLDDPRDLVAADDALVRVPMFTGDPPARATTEHLEAVVAAGRRIGVARLREALPLVRTRSASRPESWCRLTLIDAGLPEPELNWAVVVAGERIACVDLAYPAERVAVEYEGGHHATDPRQWSRDIERYERLAAAGWIVIRVTKDHLFTDPAAVVARVRRALAER
ncbi:endonuclease domain-containing protein [Microbacterium sp. 179-B 1A2 NHS]|uniref:endonuclease domain-containing protein n=1 Tax=Microbacterium sp. 179-B 1A2 NHS TaxID=3142383 RepID=UPI0039A1C616